jgi:hypothetical protein
LGWQPDAEFCAKHVVKIDKRHFLYRISSRPVMGEKSLLMYWADKGHNATVISAKMETHFGSSAPSYS